MCDEESDIRNKNLKITSVLPNVLCNILIVHNLKKTKSYLIYIYRHTPRVNLKKCGYLFIYSVISIFNLFACLLIYKGKDVIVCLQARYTDIIIPVVKTVLIMEKYIYIKGRSYTT